MHLLVLSATYAECRPVFEWLDAHPAVPAARVISGIGQLAAAVALQKQVSLARPGMIIQAGIAGAASPEDTAKVFAVEREVLADLGADEPGGFHDIFDLKLADSGAPPYSDGALVNPYRSLLAASGLPLRTGLTVNHISANKELLQKRKQKYPSFVESMEGAALHYIAIRENIPFLQIRAVSNEAGERDKSRWHFRESIAALNETLQSLIQKFSLSDETYFRI